MKPDFMNELSEKLAALIGELKPAPELPEEEIPKGELVALDGRDADNSRWISIIVPYLEKAQTFEIHCWHGEEDIFALALPFGVEQETDWAYGRIVKGEVTPAFRDMLLSQPRPADREAYNKMTPFFNVFLDDFQSSHYGTELFIPEK
ncbi:MAG: hypothetical protein IKM07_07755 [Clostridia bacterium]|nr:hypothetical protein [Clostridia bacterium]